MNYKESIVRVYENNEEYIVKVYDNGDTLWYNKEEQLHRLNGPAVKHGDGYKSYWINDKCHNLEGPAIIHPNGEVTYYIEDERYSKKDWEQEVKRIKSSLTPKD